MFNQNDLAKALGISDEEKRTLDNGSRHPYDCRCQTCLEWWALVGPEEQMDGSLNYGPFTEDEVQEAAKKMEGGS